MTSTSFGQHNRASRARVRSGGLNPRYGRLSAAVASVLLLVALVSAPLPAADETKLAATDVESRAVDVRKLFAANCIRCHGEKQRKADLNLETAAGVLKGSESGEVVVAGKPEKSPLYEMVHGRHMPPEGEGKLTDAEIESIRQWIEEGAKFPRSAATPVAVTQHDIVPLMYLRCSPCHGLRRREAGLDLRSKAGMLKGGKSGPAIVPGNAAESLVLKKIHSGEMPPRREVVAVSIKPMEPNEIQLLERWIAAGAPESAETPADATADAKLAVSDTDRAFWSFQPPKRAAVPIVASRDQVATPVDAFLLAKLEAKGLTFSPAAEKVVLVRRAWFDLIGLPPTPQEIDEVLGDSAEGWFERMIDRLLASPRYGERWARYWLDLAGYSESQGIQDSDIIRPETYRYRDYVIRAFNSDKPYDRFLLEQIAGDELADYDAAPVIDEEQSDNLVATGFLRMCADGTHSNITNFVPDRLEIIAQELEILTSATLGLTMKCARCHSHKFDPIPHQDYYRLAAVFKGAMDEHDWMNPESNRFLPQVTTAERSAWDASEKRIASESAALNEALAKSRGELIAKYTEERLAKLPADVRDQIRPLLPVPKDKLTPQQKELVEKHEKEIRIDEAELKKIDEGYRKLAEETAAKVNSLQAQRTPQPRIRALWDRGEPSPTYVLKRGNYLTPGRPVEPGPPTILSDDKAPYAPVVLNHKSPKTGRRLAFARWLTRPGHPLTARVMVNRVWEHHFGTGLVETTDNFGKTGSRPTHPELLDWLATEFEGAAAGTGVQGPKSAESLPDPGPRTSDHAPHAWSIKHLHRLILTSNAWRQASRVEPAHEQTDPENRLLARFPLRRLDAESLRDSLVSVAGRTNDTLFGPSDPVDVRGDGLVTPRGANGHWRRTIYVLQRRTTIPTLLDNFDLPAMSPNCVVRRQSTVAPQALFLLNDSFVNDLAGHFARRVERDAGNDPGRQIETAYRIAAGRPPSDDERTTAAEFLQKLTDQWQSEVGGQERVLTATTHLWIRESEPERFCENDLISVWSSKSSDGARRFGLIEFDAASLKGIELRGARLELGSILAAPIKQSAAFIPPGIGDLRWSSYQKTKSSQAVALEELGRYDLQVDAGKVGKLLPSRSASPADLKLLAERVEHDGKLAFVLMPVEDGGAYSQDWDDGVHPGTRRNPPRLVVRDATPNVEAGRRHALTNLCRALLNSAAFLYVD